MASAIPITYVPARNTIFLSLALAWAEVLGAFDIFIGVNAVDYSGYPDCRPEFIAAFEPLANLATKAGVEGGRFRIHAPLIAADARPRSSAWACRWASTTALTHSLLRPVAGGAGVRAVRFVRAARAGFAAAGVADPTRYVPWRAVRDAVIVTAPSAMTFMFLSCSPCIKAGPATLFGINHLVLDQPRLTSPKARGRSADMVIQTALIARCSASSSSVSG